MRLLTRREIATVGREVHQQMHMFRLPGELGQFGPEVCAYVPHDLTLLTCSACGVKDGPKPLHVRARCPGCGAWLDRDINAAVNVARAAGLAVTACRAQVRPEPVPAQRSEAGTHPQSRREVA